MKIKSLGRMKIKLKNFGGLVLGMEWNGFLGVWSGVESELSSKTEGIGVPPALEEETGKRTNKK